MFVIALIQTGFVLFLTDLYLSQSLCSWVTFALFHKRFRLWNNLQIPDVIHGTFFFDLILFDGMLL